MGQFSNAKPNVPYVFEEIMKSDRRREALKAQKIIKFQELKELIQDRRSLTKDAEKLLRWNTDKGN